MTRQTTIAAAAFAFACLAGCATLQPQQSVRESIARELAQIATATRNEDIDLFMDAIPGDIVINDSAGGRIDRDQLRQNVLARWAVIERTLDLTFDIERLEFAGDTATVWTQQRWERIVRPPGEASRTVLTTRRHLESWRKVDGRWRQYKIDELEGSTSVNGTPAPKGGR